MANPYSVAVPSLYEALLAGESGYKGMRDMQSQRAMQDARREAESALAGGGDTRSAMARLLGAGDVQGANALAQFGNQDFERQYKTRHLDLLEKSANRREVPAGFEPGPAGGLRPVPGGPADPAYIEGKTKATEKPRNMSVGDVTKLQEEGGKFANLTGFSTTFKDDYTQSVTGNMRNTMARNLPEWATAPEAREAATWWQGYDRFKNVVRNDLFGSALTANEQAAFEKADVNPTMAPSLIKENLKIQKSIAETALKRKASALVSEGYRPESISAAYGVKLEDLGVSPQRGGASRPQAAPQPQIQEGRTATHPQTGAKIRFQGGQWVPVQ
jgi:hypothetical protein